MDDGLFSLVDDLPDELETGVTSAEHRHEDIIDDHGKVPSHVLSDWCDGCRSLRQELDKANSDHNVNYNMLKEKIIQTDLLIKRYNAKCQECDGKAKLLDAANLKVDKVQRDCDTLATNLKNTLEESEPLRKAKERLEKHKENLKRQVQELETRVQALEVTNRQITTSQRAQASKLEKLDSEQFGNKAKIKDLEISLKKAEASAKKYQDDFTSKKKEVQEFKQHLHKQGREHKKQEKRIAYYEGILIKHGLHYAINSRIGRQSCDSSVVSHDLSEDWETCTTDSVAVDDDNIQQIFREMGALEAHETLLPLLPILSPLPPSPAPSQLADLEEGSDGDGESFTSSDPDLESVADILEGKLLCPSPKKSPKLVSPSHAVLPSLRLQRQLPMDDPEFDDIDNEIDYVGEIPFNKFKSEENSNGSDEVPSVDEVNSQKSHVTEEIDHVTKAEENIDMEVESIIEDVHIDQENEPVTVTGQSEPIIPERMTTQTEQNTSNQELDTVTVKSMSTTIESVAIKSEPIMQEKDMPCVEAVVMIVETSQIDQHSFNDVAKETKQSIVGDKSDHETEGKDHVIKDGVELSNESQTESHVNCDRQLEVKHSETIKPCLVELHRLSEKRDKILVDYCTSTVAEVKEESKELERSDECKDNERTMNNDSGTIKTSPNVNHRRTTRSMSCPHVTDDGTKCVVPSGESKQKLATESSLKDSKPVRRLRSRSGPTSCSPVTVRRSPRIRQHSENDGNRDIHLSVTSNVHKSSNSIHVVDRIYGEASSRLKLNTRTAENTQYKVGRSSDIVASDAFSRQLVSVSLVTEQTNNALTDPAPALGSPDGSADVSLSTPVNASGVETGAGFQRLQNADSGTNEILDTNASADSSTPITYRGHGNIVVKPDNVTDVEGLKRDKYSSGTNANRLVHQDNITMETGSSLSGSGANQGVVSVAQNDNSLKPAESCTDYQGTSKAAILGKSQSIVEEQTDKTKSVIAKSVSDENLDKSDSSDSDDCIGSHPITLPKQASTGFDVHYEEDFMESPHSSSRFNKEHQPWSFPLPDKDKSPRNRSPVRFFLKDDSSDDQSSQLVPSHMISVTDEEKSCDSDISGVPLGFTTVVEDMVGVPLEAKDDDWGSMSPASLSWVDELPSPISPLSDFGDEDEISGFEESVEQSTVGFEGSVEHSIVGLHLDDANLPLVTDLSDKDTSSLHILAMKHRMRSRIKDKELVVKSVADGEDACSKESPKAAHLASGVRTRVSRVSTRSTTVKENIIKKSVDENVSTTVENHVEPNMDVELDTRIIPIRRITRNTKAVKPPEAAPVQTSQIADRTIPAEAAPVQTSQIPPGAAPLQTSQIPPGAAPVQTSQIATRTIPPAAAPVKTATSSSVPSQSLTEQGEDSTALPAKRKRKRKSRKKRRSLQAGVLLKQARLVTLSIPKQDQQSIEREIQNLLRFTSTLPQDTADKLHSQGLNPKGVVDLIIKHSLESSPDVITSWHHLCQAEQVNTNEPWLTERELKFIDLVKILDTKDEDHGVISYFMASIKTTLHHPVPYTPQPGLLALCRMFVSLCRSAEELERCRVFVYDLVYLKMLSFPTMVCAVAGAWPLVLCKDKQDVSPLITVLEYVIVVKCLHDNKPRLKMISVILNKLCGWEKTSLDRDELAKHILKRLNTVATSRPGVVFDCERALDLLACHEDWTWANDVLVRNYLWPILQQWSSRQDDKPTDGMVQTVLRLLGCVMSHCPPTKPEAVRQTMMTLRALLQGPQTEQVSRDIQMAAIHSMVRLSSFDPEQATLCLQTWIQDAGRASNMTEQDRSLVHNCLKYHEGRV